LQRLIDISSKSQLGQSNSHLGSSTTFWSGGANARFNVSNKANDGDGST
jgi:hypothetical protein